MTTTCDVCTKVVDGKTCPVLNWLDIFEKKWAIRIVKELNKTNMSFNDLKRAIPGVTQGMLSERLQDLQEGGLIHRKVINSKPLAVEYSLTKEAKQMLTCWK